MRFQFLTLELLVVLMIKQVNNIGFITVQGDDSGLFIIC